MTEPYCLNVLGICRSNITEKKVGIVLKIAVKIRNRKRISRFLGDSSLRIQNVVGNHFKENEEISVTSHGGMAVPSEKPNFILNAVLVWRENKIIKK